MFDIIDAYYILDEYGLSLDGNVKAKEHWDLSDSVLLWSLDYEATWYVPSMKWRSNEWNIGMHWKCKMDEDFDSEEETGLYQSWEDDLENLNLLEHKIKDENYKPMVELKLWPIYGCHLIDCLTHNFNLLIGRFIC